MPRDLRTAQRATRLVALRVTPAFVAVRDVVTRKHYHTLLSTAARQTQFLILQIPHFLLQVLTFLVLTLRTYYFSFCSLFHLLTMSRLRIEILRLLLF